MFQFNVLLLSLGLLVPTAQAAVIRVGSSPVVSSAGLYIALDKGYFKDQGLDVEITDIANSGAPMTVLLQSGQLDVGAGNLTSGLFKAIAQGAGIKLVADKGHISADADYIALLVRRDLLASGRFKSLKDLKGFKLGLTALDGVSQQILTERFLKKAGLNEKSIQYVKLSYAEINTALKTKQIDASVQLEPFLTQASEFAKVVASGSEVYPGQQSAALFYSTHFIKNKDAANRFMVAYLKGVRIYNRGLRDAQARQDVVGILKHHLGIADALWEKMRPVGLDNDGKLNLASLTDDLNWYNAKGFLPAPVKVEDVVDLSFASAAAQKLNAN